MPRPCLQRGFSCCAMKMASAHPCVDSRAFTRILRRLKHGGPRARCFGFPDPGHAMTAGAAAMPSGPTG
jgi:hypothetical protein